MLSKSRDNDWKSFPLECYRASFYDFFLEGKMVNLRECKIIATKIVNAHKKIEDRYMKIYFYLEEYKTIVTMSINEQLSVIEPKIPTNGDRSKYDTKKYTLSNYNAFDPVSPNNTIAFLMDLESKWIRVNKRIECHENLKHILDKYESHINYSAYQVDQTPEIIFFCNYPEIYRIIKSTISYQINKNKF